MRILKLEHGYDPLAIICPELECEIARVGAYVPGGKKWAKFLSMSSQMYEALKAVHEHGYCWMSREDEKHAKVCEWHNLEDLLKKIDVRDLK